MEWRVNPQGAVAEKLEELELAEREFYQIVEKIRQSAHPHPKFVELYPTLQSTGDVPANAVNDLFYVIFGCVYEYKTDYLSQYPAQWADRMIQLNNGLYDMLEMTSFDDRGQYDDLERRVYNWLCQRVAPRSLKEFTQYLNSLLGSSDFEDLDMSDLEFWGQLKLVIQQGPQDAILAHINGTNEPHNEWAPLEPEGTFPSPQSGDVIANCFWGPVRKYKHQYRDKVRWMVSKTINLKKHEKNKTCKQKFNDEPPLEIACHRFMCNYFYQVPGILRCPYIVNLHGVTTDDSNQNIYYWMEFGTDYFSEIATNYQVYYKRWKQKLKKNGFGRKYVKANKSEWEIQRCIDFLKLARGMEFMHKLGIAHRDFKLENTIKGLDNDPKIIDFGVCHRFGLWEQSHFRCKDRVGTATYMSPECTYCSKPHMAHKARLRQYEHWDARANDIWTLGVALFMMLFACPPYDACTVADTRFVYLTEGKFMPTGKSVPRQADLYNLLKAYSRTSMVTDQCVDFLKRFFVPEAERITMEQIFMHPWVIDQLKYAPPSKERQ